MKSIMKSINYLFAVPFFIVTTINLSLFTAAQATNDEPKIIIFTFNDPKTNKIILESKYRIIYSERSPEETRQKFFMKASQECFHKIRPQGFIDEEKAMDLTDICANPRISYSNME
ncbi:MAG: hypothetical protein NZ480_05260 [Bdellovibrionaceae bacterium]|nr:hypothetical protein [Pseudobdellovibrionaceae bacterium]MDW8190759.1 hypothetical protein [Pseudobdellovibrionaceae bacterium]